MSFTLHGVGVSRGIAIGPVHLIARNELEINEYSLAPEHLEQEVLRFESALTLARQQLYTIREQAHHHQGSEVASFIDLHLMMLSDTMLTQAPIELIQTLRCNAEWALKLQKDRISSVFDSMEDPYLRTRKDDVQQVIKRVQTILISHAIPGQEMPEEEASLPKSNSIVLADDLTPADTVLMQHQGVNAFITEFGGTASHTSILARSLGIPAVVGLRRARRYIKPDDTLVVDGYHGVVIVDPDKRILRHYRTRQNEEKRYRNELGKLRQAPTVTLDGIPITLHANIEFPEDIAAVRRSGTNGIGLYRTEFLYMNRDTLPDEEEQFEAYDSVVQALKGGPVTIRTLDLGADKPLPHFMQSERPTPPNPALGLRAIRMCLKDNALFKAQLRAILRASRHGTVRILLPMISGLHEIIQMRQVLGEVQEELREKKIKFDSNIPLGVMVEVPSVALCTDLYAPHLEFFSIGTNDLIQYTLAIDRGDDEVNYLYEPMHPAVLRLLKMTIGAAGKADKPVSMCGEMAGDSRYVRLLLGMGLRSFSVNPESLLEVKRIINTTRISGLSRQVNQVMKRNNSTEIMELLEKMNTGIRMV